MPFQTFAYRGNFVSPLTLDSYIVRHPESTFYVKVEGGSMEGAGISSEDLLVVDRSLEPNDGRIVLAVVDGEFTVRRLTRRNGAMVLAADPLPESRGGWSEREAEKPIRITGDAECFVWGVVVGSLKKL